MNNTNKNFIIVLIMFSSLVSGLIGSYIFLYFISPELNNVRYETITKEITKNGKNITITNLESEVTKLAKTAGVSVVNIIIKKDIDLYRRDPYGFFQEKVGTTERKIGGGSGFFVSKDGIIMTNKHVVYDKDAKYTVITNEGKEYDAKVLALDPLTDLAIIKIEGENNKNFKVLPIIDDSKYIDIGQFVIAIGNALGEFQNSLSFGVISGKNRSIIASGNSMGSEELNGLLQTDAAINPGNSGGPLLNLAGEIIGINTAISGDGQGLGFSIPLSKKKIDFILSSIKKYNEIKRPLIGINYIVLNPEISKEYGLNTNYGAYIPKEKDSILYGSMAQKSGIVAGDIILEVDGIQINTKNSILGVIQNKIPGDLIKLKVLKDNGDIKDINLELGEY
ncbi:trypsin-like peptidase domain-containing protein [Candidatus Gracilibacteria bacterium]|nr:trypsin-like peptidase domain-containing protein [Candidatus Gracilibacteria bacterium]